MVEHPTVTSETLTTPEGPSDSIPWVNSVFEQPWWLECVAPGAWGEAVVRRGDEVVARLPYALRQRYGLPTITQPQFTQTLGPWLAPSEGKYARRLEVEKNLLGQLIEMLPRFESGELVPVIDRRYPLDAIADAHTAMEANENVGKILIDVSAARTP